MTILFDLTTLGLSLGVHNIQVKATASGYEDSNFSNTAVYDNTSNLLTSDNYFLGTSDGYVLSVLAV